MNKLEKLHLVQFFLYDKEEIAFGRNSAFFGPNGTGKSALLDAIQLVMLGCDATQIEFNAQADTGRHARTIRNYCLGIYGQTEAERARDTALTYISLVFKDEASGVPLTAGCCIQATHTQDDHKVKGLYILPGVALDLNDHVIAADGAERSMEWAQFSMRIAERCKRAHQEAVIAETREKFGRELLQRLCGKTSDYQGFRRAFKRALNLQKIESVDEAVREHMIENRPTNVQRFRKIVDSCNELRKLLAEVRAQIEQLTRISRQYELVAKNAATMAAVNALQHTYNAEWHAELLEGERQKERQAKALLTEAQRSLQRLQNSWQAKVSEVESAHSRVVGHGAYKDEGARLAQIKDKTTLVNDLLVRLRRMLLRASASIDKAGASPLAPNARPNLGAAGDLLKSVMDNFVPSGVDEAISTLDEATGALEAACREVEAGLARLRDELERATQKHREIQENLKRVSTGRSELSNDALKLQGYLRDSGIQAEPVCDLVQVSDPSWQRALEAYLRSHREALLIPENQEEQAFALYRSLKDGREVYGVRMALTSHARRWKARQGDRLAANLIEGKNADAVTYLRMQLGSLQCVDTEREAIASDQGLTRDGMLVKGGGIERLRLPMASELRLGATNNRDRRSYLENESKAAAEGVARLTQSVREAEELRNSLVWALDRVETVQDFGTQAHAWATGVQELDSLQEQQKADEDPQLAALRTVHTQLKGELDVLQIQIGDANKVIGEQQKEMEGAASDAKKYEAEVGKARAAESAAQNDPDYDHQVTEEVRKEIDLTGVTPQAGSAECQNRYRNTADRKGRNNAKAWGWVTEFCREFRMDVDGSMMEDWRKARSWVDELLSRLQTSKLADYTKQSEDAYKSAVQSFRTDVASTLADNFDRLRLQLEIFNKTLRECPPFTNDERYRYKWDVVEAYKGLHDFIVRVGKAGNSEEAFGSLDDIPPIFKELLEGTEADGPPEDSPLNDYRRFFAFDVEIIRDGKSAGVLSKRLGPASGGEGRAPLYVIVGAALATAYGNVLGQTGAGLMLIDEAFTKMDMQNPIATVAYLNGLGLQLVMAAPEGSIPMMSTFVDRYYEMYRDGEHVFMTPREVSDAARELMTGDLPEVHPELVEEEAKKIAAKEAERDAMRARSPAEPA